MVGDAAIVPRKWDLMRVLPKTGFVAIEDASSWSSNDAKGCYDCIIHTVLQVALLRLGIPKPALQSIIKTIQEMDHFVRTAFGVSTDTYGFDPACLPVQGILQGNGTGPAGWFAIGSDLLHIMEAAGFGY